MQGRRKEESHGKLGMIEQGTQHFTPVPVLRVLFLKILASQGLATLLNVCFVQSLVASFAHDDIRAGWIGHFYAFFNFISMTGRVLHMTNFGNEARRGNILMLHRRARFFCFCARANEIPVLFVQEA